ncbi:MAG: hypothetical protein Q3M30_14345 [Candidatus Electrothrix sp. Rat3]|nr:hypothetical protein [Candidatus Electrothrix rattekaaiensis]
MPLGAIAEGIFSVISECILQIVLEGMIKGAGYFILRYIFQLDRNDDLNPDGAAVIITGILFWLLVSFSGYKIWHIM